MYYRFEKLEVWVEARLFIKEIYFVVDKFPKNEQFILGDQLKRAAISIALNIAEGSDKKSDKDFVRYLRIALGSINEVVTALYIALDLEYIDQKNFQKSYKESHKLAAMINSLVRKIN
ncbi:MAG TPA: four helix bundle protein [Patescibacteria group bacterium]|nr:four helix bundle protein [Patescibacteria group bacterium]